MTAARCAETKESDEAHGHGHGHGWIVAARLAPRQQIHSRPSR